MHAVLSSPVLKEAYKYYAVSTFSFENFFFLERVDLRWRALFERDASTDEIRSEAEDMVGTFLGDSAPWEISLSHQTRARLANVVAQPEAELLPNLFDQAYDLTMRDLNRGLNQFQATPLYASYLRNQEALETLMGCSHEEVPVFASRSEMMTRLRHLYKTSKTLRLTPHASDGSEYTHQVLAGRSVCGYATQASFHVALFDLTGTELIRVPADSFSAGSDADARRRGRSSTAPNKLVVVERRKSSVGERIRLSLSRSRSSSAGGPLEAERLPAVVLLRAGGPTVGPIGSEDVLLWWKFHLLKTTTQISMDGGKQFVPVGELTRIFEEKARIQMVDPRVF